MDIIHFKPSRNQITFSNIIDVDLTICSPSLIEIIKFLKSILADIKLDKTIFDIRANLINWSFKLKTITLDNTKLIKILKNDFTCCYININSIIYHNTNYKDIYNLQYNPLSFRQPDNHIRSFIINWLLQQFNTYSHQSYTFIGGECTLFGKLIPSSSNIHFITDFQSIYNDLLFNYPSSKHNIDLINYKTSIIKWMIDTCIVANTGYNGLEQHLANQLLLSNSKVIYIISCNEYSFNKDYDILRTRYMMKKIECKTNYSVWIYTLELQC